jgi:hypothetical protein
MCWYVYDLSPYRTSHAQLMAAMLLFSFYKKINVTKVTYFPKIHYDTPVQDPNLSGSSGAPTSQVRASALL